MATRDKRTLMTLNKGLGDIRVYPPRQFAGISLLRPSSTAIGAVSRFVHAHLPSIVLTSLKGRLVVITELGPRFR